MGIEVSQLADRSGDVLAPEVLDFLAVLQREFGPRRLELLATRRRRHVELAGGGTLDFRPDTREIREGD
jgi:malate synthase